jgi:protein tyrosine/serine phosphatase
MLPSTLFLITVPIYDLAGSRETMSNQKSNDELSALLASPIREPLPPSTVEQYLSLPPFIPVPHALNLRTISSPSLLAPNVVFRSGALGHLPVSILNTLRTTYNITAVYDLRSKGERERDASPDIEGIETIWIPSTSDFGSGGAPPSGTDTVQKSKRVMSETKIAEFVEKNGEVAYVRMYGNILDLYRDAYRAILLRLAEPRAGSILFHCTAGKDRTGVLAALILAVVGASQDEIDDDYMLTRIGVEPFRTRLVGVLLKQMGVSEEEGLRRPGIEEICGVRKQNIRAVLRWMDDKWGGGQVSGDGKYPGVEGYLRQELKLTDEELDRIRLNLKTPGT